MAIYTFNTTPLQDAALAAVVAQVNADIDAENARALATTPKGQQPPTPKPHINVQDYLIARVNDVLANYADQHQDNILANAIAKYPTITAANRTTVLTTLGFASLSALSMPDQINILSKLGADAFRNLTPAQQNTVMTALFS